MQATQLSAATARLIGDWTIAGVIQQVTRLSELEVCSGRFSDTVVIDCSGIIGIDLSGFQLLYVWIHCMQLIGLRPELVNVPGWMREAQERQGLVQVFENELQERGSLNEHLQVDQFEDKRANAQSCQSSLTIKHTGGLVI